jgi:hypothetical protein
MPSSRVIVRLNRPVACDYYAHDQVLSLLTYISLRAVASSVVRCSCGLSTYFESLCSIRLSSSQSGHGACQ